jgi:hypothetical protein
MLEVTANAMRVYVYELKALPPILFNRSKCELITLILRAWAPAHFSPSASYRRKY